MLGFSQTDFSRLISPLLSLGFTEEGTLVFYFLYSIIFRADLDPKCDQELRREQISGVENAWRGSWLCGLAQLPGIATGSNPDPVTSGSGPNIAHHLIPMPLGNPFPH